MATKKSQPPQTKDKLVKDIQRLKEKVDPNKRSKIFDNHDMISYSGKDKQEKHLKSKKKEDLFKLRRDLIRETFNK